MEWLVIPMSVRRKTLLSLGLTSISLLVLLFALAQIILMRGFDRLQEEAVHQNILRIQNTLKSELDNLSSFAGDWGYWDDTYQYIQDKNEEYAASNLNDGSISNLKINLIIYTDVNNAPVFGEFFDFKDNHSSSVPLDLDPRRDLLSSVLDLPELTSTNTGLILTAEGPLLVAAKSILTSQKTGPAKGKIVFGRLLDTDKINAFAEQTQLKIEIRPINASDSPADFQTAGAALLAPNAPAVLYQPHDDAAEGYTLLNDINGNPALILEMAMPNSIYQQGQQSVLYFVIALLVAGVTFGAVGMMLLEKIVLARLAYLNKRVSEISSSSNLSERIVMAGSDELSNLTSTINNSLEVMEQSRGELKRLNSELEDKVNDLNALQAYRDRFFSNAAHEFRTPLATLRTQLYLAQKQPEQWQKHVELLTTTTNKLSDILSDVFDMAQFKRQNGNLSRQEVELKSLVVKTITAERTNANKKRLQFISEFPHDEIYVQGDQGALENAFEKLLTFITNGCAPDSRIQIQLSTTSGRDGMLALFEVCTKGLHVTESDIPNMFLPFYQSSEGSISNTGLQLSVVKEIAELHKGEVSVYVNGEPGACFSVKLPLIRMTEVPVA